MGLLAQIANAVDDYNRFVAQQVERASTDAKFIARQNEIGDMGNLQKVVVSSAITSG